MIPLLIGIVLGVIITIIIWKLVVTPVKTANKKIKKSEHINVGYGPFKVEVKDENPTSKKYMKGSNFYGKKK